MSTSIVCGLRAWKLGLVFLLVAACSGPAPRLEVTADTSGPTVLAHLQERYAENLASCVPPGGGNQLPAVLCSGVLLRATRRGAGYDAWNPNPGSPTPNGVAFSWLRQDADFSTLAYSLTNGFILIPYFYADSASDGYTQLTVRCVFPIDGATDTRTGGNRDGCGESAGIPGSGPCQPQGITTAQQWLAKFQGGNMYGDQCGFNLLPGTADAWKAFQAHWQIRQALPAWFPVQNEVIVGTWTQGDTKIPLEAFFYINGNTAGLGEAKQNQVDFKTRAGRWVPVIRINLPPSSASAATFAFNTADQGIQQ